MTNPLPTEQQIAEIAEKLTKGESRAVLICAPDGRLPKHTGRNKLGRAQALTLPTIRNLQDIGLVSDYPYRLTPLGVAVRNHLNTMGEKAC